MKRGPKLNLIKIFGKGGGGGEGGVTLQLCELSSKIKTILGKGGGEGH